jgi:hypothetical protein
MVSSVENVSPQTPGPEEALGGLRSVPDPAPAVFGKTFADQEAQYRFAAEQTVATLRAQQDELVTLRTRAVQLMAFLGTATSFLAGTLLKGVRDPTYQHLGVTTALVLAVVAVIMFASILTGRPDALSKDVRSSDWWVLSEMKWSLQLRGDVLTSWIDNRAPKATFYRKITIDGRQMELRNQYRLKAIRRRYGIFVAAILGQLSIWITLAVLYG